MFQGRLWDFVHHSNKFLYSYSAEFLNFSLKHTHQKVVIMKIFHFRQIRNLRYHGCLFRETFNIIFFFFFLMLYIEWKFYLTSIESRVNREGIITVPEIGLWTCCISRDHCVKWTHNVHNFFTTCYATKMCGLSSVCGSKTVLGAPVVMDSPSSCDCSSDSLKT